MTAHPNRRLSEDVVREILSSSERICEIAARLGMTRQHVHAIRSGRLWAHVR